MEGRWWVVGQVNGGRWRRCARAPSSHRRRTNLRSVCAANSSLAFRTRRRLVGATVVSRPQREVELPKPNSQSIGDFLEWRLSCGFVLLRTF